MLSAQSVSLMPILREDAGFIFKWRNSYEIMSLDGFYRPMSQICFDEWFEQIGKSSLQVVFSIRKNPNLEFIGYVEIKNIHPSFRTAEISIVIGDQDQQGKGHGSQALDLCLKFCWSELNLNRLYLLVMADNQRALSCYTRVGFVKEGTLRQAVYRNGAYVDGILMSVLRPQDAP